MWVNSSMDCEAAFVGGRRPPLFQNFFIYQDRRMKFDRHIVLRTGLVERGGGGGRKEGEVEREMVEGEVEEEMGGRGERNKLLPLPLPSPTLSLSPFPLTPVRRTGHTASKKYDKPDNADIRFNIRLC